VSAIAKHSLSPSLSKRLTAIEAELAGLPEPAPVVRVQDVLK
jgi:hypothetical protein